MRKSLILALTLTGVLGLSLGTSAFADSNQYARGGVLDETLDASDDLVTSAVKGTGNIIKATGHGVHRVGHSVNESVDD